jgi:hypothetical protein
MAKLESQDHLARSPVAVELDRLCQLSNGKGLTMAMVFGSMQERSYVTALLLLSSPFLIPLPTMGLSGPVGVAVMLGGFCLMSGAAKLRLLSFAMRRQIPHASLASISGAVGWVSAWVGRHVRPRLGVLFWPGVNALTGLGLVSAGFALSLPLPIPFANAVPAAAIFLLCLGYLERDGLVALLGHGVGLGAWVHLWVVGDAVRAAFGKAAGYLW